MKVCPHCKGDIEIRNPTGFCDHLYYPDMCEICRGEPEKAWVVYMVRCRDRSLYTGITLDISRRITEHNRGIGAKYTRSRRPVVLVFTQVYREHGQALQVERVIKSMTRKEKEELIELDGIKLREIARRKHARTQR